MADDDQQDQNNNDDQTRDQPSGYTPPATQADLDRIVGERLARERAKFAGYDDYKAKAEKYDAAQQADMTELQRAQAALDEVKADRDAARIELTVAQHDALRARVAAAKGVPAHRISGDTEDELNADADAYLAEGVAAHSKKTSWPDLGQGRREQVAPSPRDAGRAEAERRFGPRKQQ